MLHSVDEKMFSKSLQERMADNVLELLKGLVNRFKLVTEQVYVNA